ncbi:hypothetical protein JCM16303_004130 [Sporobolomyces ruberrimus]
MILTTSYLFSHLSPDSETLFITPYTPEKKRDPNELIPIQVSHIAFCLRHDQTNDEKPLPEVTCYYLGRNSESSYTTFKFTLDSDSPQLPSSLDHLIVSTLRDNLREPKRIDLVYNPKSGHGYSSALLNDVVKSLLKPLEENGLIETKVWETTGENDGERIGREISQKGGNGERTVLVLGGDGTIHEVLNGAVLKREGTEIDSSKLDLVVIPTGTANALYYHLFPPESLLYPDSTPLSPFYSFLSFLRRSNAPLPLPLALNTINHSASSTIPRVPPILTSVVTSAALHACLLHDAEALRSTYPGLERFKIAAQENVKQWWDGTISLRNTVKRYDSKTKGFVQRGNGEDEVKLEGPFAYWVSSLVSRFEPSFVVAPLRSPQHQLAPSEATNDAGSIDLVVIRPRRHVPTREAYEAGGDEEEVKKGFADTVWQVTGGMYQGGAHVDMLYPQGEGFDDPDAREAGQEQGETEIVEIWRTSEFVWTPVVSSKLKSNLICLDGALHDLGEGGSLTTRVLASDETGVRVWS